MGNAIHTSVTSLMTSLTSREILKLLGVVGDLHHLQQVRALTLAAPRRSALAVAKRAPLPVRYRHETRQAQCPQLAPLQQRRTGWRVRIAADSRKYRKYGCEKVEKSWAR